MDVGAGVSDRLMACEHCRFWHESHSGMGLCRRHAPTAQALKPEQADWRSPAVWPSTRGSDTCGDFSWRPAQQERA